MHLHRHVYKNHPAPAAASEALCRWAGLQNPSEKSLRQASFGRPVRTGGSDPEEGT